MCAECSRLSPCTSPRPPTTSRPSPPRCVGALRTQNGGARGCGPGGGCGKLRQALSSCARAYCARSLPGAPCKLVARGPRLLAHVLRRRPRCQWRERRPQGAHHVRPPPHPLCLPPLLSLSCVCVCVCVRARGRRIYALCSADWASPVCRTRPAAERLLDLSADLNPHPLHLSHALQLQRSQHHRHGGRGEQHRQLRLVNWWHRSRSLNRVRPHSSGRMFAEDVLCRRQAQGPADGNALVRVGGGRSVD